MITTVKQGKISHAGPRTTEGAELVRKERLRQIDIEGCTSDQDDEYVGKELILGAMAYLNADIRYWPKLWERIPYKPKSRIEDLIRGAALVAAEIDRLLRDQHQRDVEQGAVGPKGYPVEYTEAMKAESTIRTKIDKMVEQACKKDVARLEEELNRLLAAGYKQDEIGIMERNGQRWAAVKHEYKWGRNG